jgi:hypothetical protein
MPKRRKKQFGRKQLGMKGLLAIAMSQVVLMTGTADGSIILEGNTLYYDPERVPRKAIKAARRFFEDAGRKVKVDDTPDGYTRAKTRQPRGEFP